MCRCILRLQKGLRELHFHQEGGHDRKNVDRDRNSEQHDADIENAQSGIVAGVDDLAVSHPRQGDDRHVQGLQERDGGAAEQRDIPSC